MANLYGVGSAYSYQFPARYLAPDHAERIRNTYEQRGGAVAMYEFAAVAADASIPLVDKRKLVADLRPTLTNVAQDLGRNARNSDLPSRSDPNKTTGLDGQDEFRATLRDLAAGLEIGSDEDVQAIAAALLSDTRAPVATKGDRLGLLGEGLRSLDPGNARLKNAIVSLLKSPAPNAPAGSELALSPQLRAPALKTLRTGGAAISGYPAGTDRASVSGYADWTANQAFASNKAARELKLDPKHQRDDAVGRELYAASKAAAAMDAARAEQAVAAELRAIYRADPNNLAATERAAQDIRTRLLAHHDNGGSLVRGWMDGALRTVLTESAAARETNIKLYQVHRADDAMNGLLANQQSGQAVADQQLLNARDAFANARKELLASVGAEIDVEMKTVSEKQAEKEGPANAIAADRIGDRYATDPELQASLDAEIILRNASLGAGPEQRMQELGRLTPRALDPTVRAIVFSDQRGAAIVDDYVDWAASQVGRAYDDAVASYDGYKHSPQYERLLFENTPPALAATQRLLELTDPAQRAYVKPEMVAQIFHKVRTDRGDCGQSTMDRIVADLSLDSEWGDVLLRKDNPNGGIPTENVTYNQVIVNLSFAAERMTRMQSASTGKYDSPAIEQEMTYLGRRLAQEIPALREPVDVGDSSTIPPWTSRIDVAFEKAASEGAVGLALETARQMLDPTLEIKRLPYAEWSRNAQADVTLKHVRAGIDAFAKDTQALYAEVNKNMAPVTSPVARFGMNFTADQTEAGIGSIYRDGKKGSARYDQIVADRGRIDMRGYQLLRLGETVGFYRHSLGQQKEFAGVDASRNKLLNGDVGISMLLLSNSATLAAGTKIALKMLDSDLAHGVLRPQKYGWIAQSSDFAEYLAETYVLQRKGSGAANEFTTTGDSLKRHARFGMPRDVAGNERLYRADKGYFEEPYKATRLGRLPLLGATVWGAGGTAGLALVEYLQNDVGTVAGGEWRKLVIEGVVGGFAAFHLAEAAVAVDRMAMTGWQQFKPTAFAEKMKSYTPFIYKPVDAVLGRDQPSMRFAFTGTAGLTVTLAGLMALASVWDISGIGYSVAGGSDPTQGAWGSRWWKVGTHAVNASSDVLLFRLQTREAAIRLKPGIADAAKKVAEQLAGKSLSEQAVRERAKLTALQLGEKAAGKLSVSRLISFAETRALTANPIGFWVNAAYLTTTGVNWFVDQKRYISDLQFYDNAFLKGAGVAQPQADLLKEHAFWTGDGKGDGFALGYQAVGGDPTKFVEYINGLDPQKLEAAIQAAGVLPDHVQVDLQQPATPMSMDYYVSLPSAMNRDVAAQSERFVFNERAQRFEDPLTQMYFDRGTWTYFGAKNAGPDAQRLVGYDPATRSIIKSAGTGTVREPFLLGGLKQEDSNAAYLALPEGDPAKSDPSRFPTIRYNSAKRRYEDSASGLYYDADIRAWRAEDDIGDMGFYYYPDQQSSAYYWPTGQRYSDRRPTGTDGWTAYLKAHDMLPPVA
ncbi:MAG TPA: hypothetical protein VFS47_01635 [Steroidobacteraceae bacterium]|nr:hypothetical protein [Steroidobacteraceae bacterium]